MQLWKLLLIALALTLAFYSSAAYLLISVADEIDNNGGLKAVAARIWEGKK